MIKARKNLFYSMQTMKATSGKENQVCDLGTFYWDLLIGSLGLPSVFSSTSNKVACLGPCLASLFAYNS